MTDAATPKPKTNTLGLVKADYKGSASTMCKGCGHDRISEAIVEATFKSGIKASEVIKLSGIGCSSKTPAYFLGASFGLNSTHGRMPSFSTGAHLANHTVQPIGVSGDGDTASIGMGQFVHMLRRNPRMIYIVENNGVYGLTKGQFSATADKDSPSKRGAYPVEESIDLCGMALELGCSFVARSFSGDKKQLVPLLQAAFSHKGMAFIDIISPCVTFNNHDESTKSYTYIKEHEIHYHDPSFVPHFEQIDVEYEEGSVQDVRMHDGSHIILKKLDKNYDASSREAARQELSSTKTNDQILTGLIYVDPEQATLSENLALCDEPLASLGQERLRPGREELTKYLASCRIGK